MPSETPDRDSSHAYDAILIGGGIMSATLGVLLKELEPGFRIRIVERLDELAQESSNAWNNAGTGHSALCELNYTPQKKDGSIDISKAVTVNEQFQVSRQVWSHLVEKGDLKDPSAFITSVPHMSVVWGAEDVAFLKARHEALKDNPLFAGLTYSDDPKQIAEWAPLLLDGRAGTGEPMAATWTEAGSDVNFGELTRQLVASLRDKGIEVDLGASVKGLRQTNDGAWHVTGAKKGERFHFTAPFVFVGAGGYALTLLQKARVPEIRGYGGFPVSGVFLATGDPAIASRHHAKVYGKAAVGAPPMSVPHLDTRLIDGKVSLLFGPYAGWSSKFLKKGTFLDLFRSIKPHNIAPMLKTGVHNVPLTVYLVKEVLASKAKNFAELAKFYPAAKPKDWRRVTAGQRVQVIRPDGTLQFGTEVIAAADGSIAGLLGASPGASTAAPIMLDVLKTCFPAKWTESWAAQVAQIAPSYGTSLAADPAKAAADLARTAKLLGLKNPTK